MDKLLALIALIATIAFLSFVFSLPLYLLWNGCLVDAIQGVREVTWLQAWGLSILASILFKNNK